MGQLEPRTVEKWRMRGIRLASGRFSTITAMFLGALEVVVVVVFEDSEVTREVVLTE